MTLTNDNRSTLDHIACKLRIKYTISKYKDKRHVCNSKNRSRHNIESKTVPK
jgi:hypothetical protein